MKNSYLSKSINFPRVFLARFFDSTYFLFYNFPILFITLKESSQLYGCTLRYYTHAIPNSYKFYKKQSRSHGTTAAHNNVQLQSYKPLSIVRGVPTDKPHAPKGPLATVRITTSSWVVLESQVAIIISLLKLWQIYCVCGNQTEQWLVIWNNLR